MRILIIICSIFITQGLYSQITFQKTYGEISKGDYGEGIIELNNGDYIICGVQVYQDSVGNYVGDGVIRRIDSNGNELWSNNFSDPNSTEQDLNFYDVIKTMDGNFVVAGVSDYGYENDYKDAFLAKINTNGDIIWQHNYGGSFAQGVLQVIETSEGGLLAVGANHTSTSANSLSLYALKIDSSGVLEWEYIHPNTSNNAIRHQAYSVIEDNQGDFIISGSINQILNNGKDFYVVKVNSNGNFLWEKIIDHNIGGEGRDVFVKNNGNILICGWYAPNFCAKPLIIELSSNGTFLSEYEFNFDSTCEWAYSFYKDSSDNTIMVSFDANNNYRIAKIDDSFTLLWDNFISYNQASSAEGNHITKTYDNGFICTGTSLIQGDIESVVFKVGENGTLSTLNIIPKLQVVNIYPNPANHILQIKTLEIVQFKNIALFDQTGRLVKNFNNNDLTLNIEGISSGIYFLKLRMEKGILTEKVIIE